MPAAHKANGSSGQDGLSCLFLDTPFAKNQNLPCSGPVLCASN